MRQLGTRSRWAVYGVALVATLAAVRWAGGQDDSVVKPQREERSTARTEATPRSDTAAREALPALDLSALSARTAAASERDLFPALNWEQKAREEEVRRNPPPKPAPPPPPQAPPLPFTYMGKLVEEGRATVFLVQGDRNLIVREGETVAGGWRVDKIGEQSMTLTYVQLDQQQTLSFAAPVARASGGLPPGAPGGPPLPGALPGPVPVPTPDDPRRDD
jgi:hypothetical protein